MPAAAAGRATCVIATTSLAFGQYVPSRPRPSDITATVELTCAATGGGTATIDGTISLIGGGPAGRQLADGPNRLRYQLFTDPARTIPWGDGSGGTSTRTISAQVGPTTPLRQTLTIYGRILGRRHEAEVGNYADQITVVLNY